MQITKRRAALITASLAATGGLVFGAADAFAASPAPSPTASSTVAPHAKGKHGNKHRAAHLRALLKHGGHGQSTVKDKTGAWVVREWQVGKVQSLTGSTVTVTDGSGTTWTWSVVAGAHIRDRGAETTLATVKAGDTVVLSGQVVGGANDAHVVIDAPAG